MEVIKKIKNKMINVIPINDLKEHSEDTTCKCKPKLILENGEMILIHNSYDGRELVGNLIDKDNIKDN